MASKGYFISVAELKKKTIIDGNVDDDKITQFIEVAQDSHIQNYIGTNLYNALQAIIIAGTVDDPGNSDYKTLLVDYIKPATIWFTFESYLPFAMFQIQNGGVYKHSPENGEGMNLEEMRLLSSRARNNAEHYTRRLIDYLCDNETLFPEYNTTSSDSDMKPDGDISYAGGWVL